MTIKEVETRTGLVRANIRYYEDQGFFSAARGENGYRDYSGENVDVLLKVKLLRQLGFSLEDIRDFQRGDQRLETALLRREEGLERERRELDRAARLCRELREDRADFDTLDARRYLERLDQEEKRGGLTEDRFPRNPFYMRRLFVRLLDWLVWLTLVRLTLFAGERFGLPPITLPVLAPELLRPCLALALMLVSETLLLHFTGTTLGKKLLGLKLLREDGSRFALGEAFRRTFWAVFVFGFYVLGFFYAKPNSGWYGYVSAAGFFSIWVCRWGGGVDVLAFWKRDNELYLEGSTREQDFWDRDESKPGVVAAVIIAAGCCWLQTLLLSISIW